MFVLSGDTKIIYSGSSTAVRNAADILKRDMDKVFNKGVHTENAIRLTNISCAPEQFVVKVDESEITVSAGDDLGFVYGLLYISSEYIGVKPFWFWMEQSFNKTDSKTIENTVYKSRPPRVRFRGWFFNDEVLMMKWKQNENSDNGWKMAFEALLRCGGNTVIPGTDKMSRKNRALADSYGLWITHHHAEPLGAEMFVRAYPGVEADYFKHPELFRKLWEDAVKEQKDCKVIWNLCFRGQGDMPFWANDKDGRFDTPEKRGRLISEVIREQCDIVRKYIENPVFCTNLYGEIMELYEQGYIDLDDDIIKVRADNGYGKMVTRRRDNHSARVSSMPDKNEKGAQGIYYHVSFYDLQAANHITMLPNTVDFVNNELNCVLENGGDDFWIINCSNVRPHVYYLDAVRKKWFGKSISDKRQSKEFADDYFRGNTEVAACYENYAQSMPSYGSNDDEHIGEQFYMENLRLIVNAAITGGNRASEGLRWIADCGSLQEQVKIIADVCADGFDKLEKQYKLCADTSCKLNGDEKQLFDATMLLQIEIHRYCAKAVVIFKEAYETYINKDFKKSFLMFGECCECFDYIDKRLRSAEYGIWENFYGNECLADVKHTRYMTAKMMGIVREFGDNAWHYKWYREYCCAKEDRDVYLLLFTDNHMTDWELYLKMKSADNI